MIFVWQNVIKVPNKKKYNIKKFWGTLNSYFLITVGYDTEFEIKKTIPDIIALIPTDIGYNTPSNQLKLLQSKIQQNVESKYKAMDWKNAFPSYFICVCVCVCVCVCLLLTIAIL